MVYDTGVLEALLAAPNIDVNAFWRTDTALHIAAEQHLELVRILQMSTSMTVLSCTKW